MEVGAIEEVRSKDLGTGSMKNDLKKQASTKKICSKFFKQLLNYLRRKEHFHMLKMLSQDEFELQLVHQKSLQFKKAHISLFKAMDIYMKGRRYLDQLNYNEKCKGRFKSNLRKLVESGYLKRVGQEKLKKSITKIRYRILKLPEYNETEDLSKSETSAVYNKDKITGASAHFQEILFPMNLNYKVHGCGNLTKIISKNENGMFGKQAFISKDVLSLPIKDTVNIEILSENKLKMNNDFAKISNFQELFSSDLNNEYSEKMLNGDNFNKTISKEDNAIFNKQLCFAKDGCYLPVKDPVNEMIISEKEIANLSHLQELFPVNLNCELSEETLHGGSNLTKIISKNENVLYKKQAFISKNAFGLPIEDTVNKEILSGNEMSLNNDVWQDISGRMKQSEDPLLSSACLTDDYNSFSLDASLF